MNNLEILNDFSAAELEEVKKLISSNSKEKIKEIKESLYRVTPPTPAEFLDKWLGPDMNIFSHVRDIFCEMWNPKKDYHETVLYGASRTGKSLLTQISIVYCITRIWCLKNPHKYYNLSRVSSMAIYLMCFSKIKAKQLLLKPIENILKSSPKFHQVLFEDKIDSTQESIGNEKIVWSTADRIGEIGFSQDIHICLASNPMDIIGANIIMAAISEINFFIEVAGVSEEDVWRVYTDTKDRIQGTIANKYGSMIILDSSANIRDNLIETYILEDAYKDPKVCYNTFNRWEVMPHLFPIWQKTGKTIQVFIGDMTRPPCVIKEDNFKPMIGDEIKIIDVPIDALDTFNKNIYKALRDIAGIATSSADLFFPNLDVVNDLVFDKYLPNVSVPIETPLMVNSTDLIMSRIRHVFMELDISKRWVVKRAKSAPRWIRVDLSESSDRTGVAMCHPEIRDDGTIICVFDFAFDIKPTKEGINLDAIKEFIRDMYIRYHLFIVGISTDKYQSSFIAQALKKDEKVYKLISVDEDKTPYLVFRSKVLNGAIKVGYYSNIYNNFRSLIETPSKIDHIRLRKNSEDNKNVGYESKDICISGDTEICLLSGKDTPIKDLVGKEVGVYSCLSSGKIVIGNASNIRKTGYREDILRVWLDNEKYLDCTVDHKLMMRDGSYKEAQELKEKDSLMPLRQSNSENKLVYVIKVEQVQGTDVYDMTVPSYNNFAISSGIFVHNCDAMAGASFDLFNNVSRFTIKYNYDDITRQSIQLSSVNPDDQQFSTYDKALLYENLMQNISNRNTKGLEKKTNMLDKFIEMNS